MWIALAVVVILAVGGFRYFSARRLPETFTRRAPDDPEMMAAIAGARKSLPMFWDRKASAPNPDDYLVKVKIVDGEDVEHFWLQDPQPDGEFVTGILDNHPGIVTNVELGDKIRAPLSDVSDWMYTEDGTIYGNYTGRILARPKNMSKEQHEHFMSRFAPLPDDQE